MNIFERWFLTRIIKREVRQGYDHAQRIEGLYRLIYDAAKAEFYEDNAPTLTAFLVERFCKVFHT